jgi:hypothetical protein
LGQTSASLTAQLVRQPLLQLRPLLEQQEPLPMMTTCTTKGWNDAT